MSSRVNEVNGENLQDPPIKNPGYANGTCHTRAAPSCDMFNLGSSYFHVALTTVRHLLNVALSTVHKLYNAVQLLSDVVRQVAQADDQ